MKILSASMLVGAFLFVPPARAAVPGNDHHNNATPISTNIATVTGSNIGATEEPGEPDHGGNAGGASVYWIWTPPINTTVAIDTFGSSFDTTLGVYVLVSGSLYPVVGNDDAPGTLQSRVVFGTAPVVYTFAIAVDGFNPGTGPAMGDIVLNVSVLPSVSLSAPANNATFTGPTNITVSATAAATAGGSIARVQFYQADQRIGEDTTAPYSVIWSNVPPGNYALTAVAFDSSGATNSSSPVLVTVNPRGFVPMKLVNANSTWKYFDTGEDLGTSWRAPLFDDQSWAGGPGPLGYGDPHIRTTVDSGPAGNYFITTYFRRSFIVTNPAVFSSLLFRLLRDDGAVVHLNSNEVFRSNMPEGTVSYLTPAVQAVSSGGETTYYNTYANAALLVPGTNVLAVEVHQQSPTSSDLGFDLEVVGGMSPGVRITSPPNPSVFNAPGEITLAANALPATGAVAQVEFFRDDQSLGAATTEPFTVDWHNVPIGRYTLRAIMTDTLGASITSSPVSVTVTAPAAPTIVGLQPPMGPVGSLQQVTVTFSEPVTGVDAGDLLVNGLPAWKLISRGGTNFTFGIVEPAPGPVHVTWAANHAIADIAVPATAFDASQVVWTYSLVDLRAPTIASVSPTAGSAIFELTRIAVSFSEAVTGVRAADLLINGRPATSVATNGTALTFSFPQPAFGTVMITWAGDQRIVDLADPPNAFNAAEPAASWSYTLDPPRTTLVATNSLWRLHRGTNEASAPMSAWRQPGFDDSAWEELPATFYFGESWPTGTTLGDMLNAYSCVFLRREFVVTNAALLYDFRLRAECDDGFIVWINGVEVQRYNMPEGEIAFDGFAATFVPEYGTPSVPFYTYPLANPEEFLVTGTNVIAVQAFNNALNSSDLVIDVELSAVTATAAVLPPEIIGVAPPPGDVTTLQEVTVTFSEPVAGVDAGDLLVNGAPATGLTALSSTAFRFTFPQPPFGPVTINWAANHGIVDLDAMPRAFNATNPAATFQYTVRNPNAPIVAFQVPLAGPVTNHLTDIVIAFSKDVTGVNAGDLLINGVPATSVIGSGVVYAFQFAQPACGPVAVTWAANHGIRDTGAAPNDFDATTPGNSWQYILIDQIAPAVAAQNPPAGAAVANLTQMTVTFTEPVAGLNAGDLLINGAPARSASGADRTFTFTFPQPNAASVRVTWAEHHGISDLAPVPNPFDARLPGATWSYTTTDNVAPSVKAVTPPPGLAVRSLRRVAVTFDEPVTGVNAADLLLNGLTAESVTGSAAGPYTFIFSEPPAGPVEFTWAAGHGIQDLVAPPNRFAGGSWTNAVRPDLPAGLAVDHVIHISVDGLGAVYPQSYLTSAPALFPNFRRLRDGGASTFEARTDFDASVTLPNHASMFTGRPVLQPAGWPTTAHHGITYDSDFGLTLQTSGNPDVPYKASVFDVAHDSGRTTAFLYSKQSLSMFVRSYDAENGAPHTNGANKIDGVLATFGGSSFGPSSPLVDELVTRIQTQTLWNYTFTHLVEPDSVGHASNWGSPAWSNAVMAIDEQLGRILDALEASPELSGRTAVILTADHGGGAPPAAHNLETNALNYTTPFFVWGAGIPAGVDLYRLFANRADPGATRPDYNVRVQPMRTGDSGNLALTLLGLPAIPGSSIVPVFGPPPVVLNVSQCGAGIRVSWPAGAGAFQLQYCTSMTSGDWQAVTQGVTTDLLTQTCSATIPTTAQTCFFRLRAAGDPMPERAGWWLAP